MPHPYYPKTGSDIKQEPHLSLTDLANKYETDKGNADRSTLSWAGYTSHYTWGYTEIYEKYMARLKNSDSPVKFLEIGICDGRFPLASVKMWLSYFKNVDLYCVDLQSVAAQVNKFGANFFNTDQGSPSDWNLIIDQLGAESLDFLVEDGSHHPYHMLYSLLRSIPLMKPDSYYFMEDIQDPQTTAGHYGYNNVTVYNTIKNFLDKGIFASELLSPDQCAEIQKNFKVIEMHYGGPSTTRTIMAVLQKI